MFSSRDVTGSIFIGLILSITNLFTITVQGQVPIITRGPYLQNGATDGVSILWRTNLNSTGRIWYGSSPANLSQIVDEQIGTLVLVTAGSNWRYLDNGSNQGTAWRDSSFDDSGWAEAPAQLGYGDGDENTVVGFGPNSGNKFITTYFRHTFFVSDPSSISSLTLELLRDDGAIVYLNGSEIRRENMPSGTIDYLTNASTGLGGATEDTFIQSTVDPALLVAGDNLLAVEIHQANSTSSDISFDLRLFESGSGGDGINHSVRITGLGANTTYFYQIGTTGDDVLAGGDSNHFFTTLPVAGTIHPVRIWAIGDSGTADANAAAVRDAYLELASLENKADLWLMLGDNAYNGGTDTEYQNAVFDMYPEILINTILWSTQGNHDRTGNAYYPVFELPTMGEGGGTPSGTEEYYSFDYSNIHLVCLNSEITSLSSNVNSPMYVWLQDDLANTNQDWIIAYFHHPPYTKGSHDSDNFNDSSGRLFYMREIALPILEAGGTDLVLSGHSHSYERSGFINGHYNVSSTFSRSTHVVQGGDGKEDGDGAYLKTSTVGAVYIVGGSSGKVTGTLTQHAAMEAWIHVLGSVVVDINDLTMDVIFLRDLTNPIQIDDYFTIFKSIGPFPEQASNPIPSDAAVDVNINSILTWTAGSNTDNHDVYFGTTSPGTFQGNQTGTTFDPGPLMNDTTYFWRVDEVNFQGTTTGTEWSFTTEKFSPGGPIYRVDEYHLSTNDFLGSSFDLNLKQDLATDYFILVRGSREGNGASNPDNDYARISGVPGGKGDLIDSGAADRISLSRRVADVTWEGVVTVVECLDSTHPGGFELLDIAETNLSGISGIDTSASTWSNIDQVVLFGGYRGGGAEFDVDVAANHEGVSVYTRLFPSGTNTINWSRNSGGSVLRDATITTFVIEWGPEWFVQHVQIDGVAGGNGADAVSDYTTGPISSVARANTWVWGSGTRSDAGIGDCAEAVLVTLGDGVNQNMNESTVAVGSEYADVSQFDIYTMTHTDCMVDYRFKADGDSTSTDVAITVDAAPVEQRLALAYNGLNGTGNAHPRQRFWARYTSDNTITVSRGRSGQNFPAWVQGVNFANFTTESPPSPLPGQPSNPSPSDAAVDVNINSILTWTAGSDTDNHDVYFGTTSPGIFQGNQIGTTFDPGPLMNDTTYFWRIDEVNAQGNTTGIVWSFTTESPPSPLPGQASNPIPSDAAVDVNINSILTWTAGSNTDSHDVYFGTTSPGTFQGNQTGTTFAPGPLMNDTTYFWRVDEVNFQGTTTGTEWSFTTEKFSPGGPIYRVDEYHLSTNDFLGSSFDLNLKQDLATDYFILVRGSREGNGASNPDNDYARISGVPGGKGDLIDSGAADRISLSRRVADVTWEGVVTVVECLDSTHPGGFELLDIAETNLSGISGIDTSASTWSNIDQVVLFGGYRGGGAEFDVDVAANHEGVSVYTRLFPSGTNTINWSRNSGGSVLRDATITTFVIEWGPEWFVQYVQIDGVAGGNGADAVSDYTTGPISSVARANTWVWGSGTRSDAGIGDCAEAVLVTLGDGVNQNMNESTVAVGSEYADVSQFDIYTMTHTDCMVDYRFKADGDSTSTDVAITVDAAPVEQRLALAYNGLNGTGNAHPRQRFWARYTSDNTITVSRGRSGQNFPAWVQGVNFANFGFSGN